MRQTQKANISQQLRSINRQFEEERVQHDAKRLGLEYCDVGNERINPDLFLLVSEPEARAAHLVPYYRSGERLRVAVSDPEDAKTVDAIDTLRAHGYKVNVTLASISGLEEAWDQYQDMIMRHKAKPTSVITDTGATLTAEEETKTLLQFRQEIQDADSADAAMTILTGAYRTGASDIHLEPYGDSTKLRLRIDGVMQDVFELPAETAKLIVEQFKHMAQMKLNIVKRPQDGRYSFEIGGKQIDVRVSTLPTVEGETIVMRILDNERPIVGLEELGMRGKALTDMLQGLHDPHGMILSTGPTGSGKTTTLYSMLNLINESGKTVVTLEDPVEYRVHGISQSQINPAEEYSFANGLRAILRQDPDIVMVGEIRDLETAEIAAQAAMTGHIVLSTLHTNDAVSAIPRLINMGLKPFVVAPSLDTVIAQRLVRRVCTACVQHRALSESEWKLFQEVAHGMVETGIKLELPKEIPHITGCEFCSHTGYRGQIGLFEVFRLTDEMKQMIIEEQNILKLYALARQHGMLTLREDGMMRVAEGITTIAEVVRVSGGSMTAE